MYPRLDFKTLGNLDGYITKPGSYWISSSMVGDYKHIIICLDALVEKSGPRVVQE